MLPYINAQLDLHRLERIDALTNMVDLPPYSAKGLIARDPGVDSQSERAEYFKYYFFDYIHNNEPDSIVKVLTGWALFYAWIKCNKFDTPWDNQERWPEFVGRFLSDIIPEGSINDYLVDRRPWQTKFSHSLHSKGEANAILLLMTKYFSTSYFEPTQTDNTSRFIEQMCFAQRDISRSGDSFHFSLAQPEGLELRELLNYVENI